MKIAFTDTGWEDYEFWRKSDEGTIEKIHHLIKDISREPFKGLGKPEPLRGNLAGFWSRRISGEHRIVYSVTGVRPNHPITIIQLRYHY